ncbi:hypothetical protein, partial [Campylobacter coli]|uniref:hypothetical protein n=1 Tax=Campylobacter coli TaxID=195 RepID=UPI001C92F1A8
QSLRKIDNSATIAKISKLSMRIIKALLFPFANHKDYLKIQKGNIMKNPQKTNIKLLTAHYEILEEKYSYYQI